MRLSFQRGRKCPYVIGIDYFRVSGHCWWIGLQLHSWKMMLSHDYKVRKL